MQKLEPPDSHHLNAAIGWLELGNPQEANAEWERIAEPNREHPEVVEVHWRIFAARKNWPAAWESACRLVRVAPDNPVGWINRSFSLHEMKRTQEAWDQLLPAAKEFPKVGIIPYNLACYACQLGQQALAEAYLAIAFSLDRKDEVKKMALNDRDLEPMWDYIKAL
jgi:tetratricopeptide (TPR) repeat protein